MKVVIHHLDGETVTEIDRVQAITFERDQKVVNSEGERITDVHNFWLHDGSVRGWTTDQYVSVEVIE